MEVSIYLGVLLAGLLLEAVVGGIAGWALRGWWIHRHYWPLLPKWTTSGHVTTVKTPLTIRSASKR